MKVLITGANGLLGQKLIALLQTKEGVSLYATSRGKARILDFKGEYFPLDATNKQEVLSLFKKLKPDVVIHTAAMTHVDECELHPEDCYVANVEAVRNVVAGCEMIDAHMVHLSTDFIFDGTEGPLSEKAVPNPINYYGKTKLEAEEIIKASKISSSIARTVLVYGVVPGLKRSNIILWVKDNLAKKNSLKIVDDQWRTPTLAEDLALGCWLLAKDKVKGIYNISGGDMLTPYEMAQLVATYFKLDNQYITRANSATFSQPAKRPPKTGFIIDKAIKKLGYRPHSFKEGIEIIAGQL